jgi:hypothetical protein
LDDALRQVTRNIAYNGAAVGLEDFLDWWHASNGRLEGFDSLSQYVDLFDEPSVDSATIKPVQIGAKSLATICFESQEVSHLGQTIEGFSKETNDSLVTAHLHALSRGEPVITHPALDEPLRTGRRFSKSYRRVLAPIYLQDGSRMVANFSQAIRPPKISSENVLQF